MIDPFASEGAAVGSDRHRELVERSLGRPARLVWTGNRSVYLSVRTPPRGWGGDLVVRLHRSFQDASHDVWTSLERYFAGGHKGVLGPARIHFESWLRQNFERADAPTGGRRRVLRPVGRYFDLREVLGVVGGKSLFSGLPAIDISWARRGRVGARSVRLGSYRAPRAGDGLALVCVHPLLDGADVPRHAVEHVVHHELVHHLLTVTGSPGAGRRHGPEFRRLEALFERHGQAEDWIQRELTRVLRAARRRR